MINTSNLRGFSDFGFAMATDTNHLLELINNLCFEIVDHFISCSDCCFDKESCHFIFSFDSIIQIEIADACIFHQNTA